jgi:hypothetical protein
MAENMLEDYSSQRIGKLILEAIAASEDPRTLRQWSRVAGVSMRTLQYACAAANVSPAACRDLARLLRLVVAALSGKEPWDPLVQLNADPRTVRRMMDRGALSHAVPPRDVGSFIVAQQLVKRPAVLAALRRHLPPAPATRPRGATNRSPPRPERAAPRGGTSRGRP